MGNVGRYCKAHYLKEIRNFPGLREDGPKATQSNHAAADGANIVDLSDDTIVYLQEDFSVTSGIARDEDVIFRSADPAWENYCRDVLNFEIPAWLSAKGIKTEPVSQA